MTWIRNSSRNQKGELALEITLEKAAVKQSGDAWRIVLDSCLPVLHLIDTSRSIPYAIKQVQELLGISCAFEQAIQVGTSFSLSPSNAIPYYRLPVVCFVNIFLTMSYFPCCFCDDIFYEEPAYSVSRRTKFLYDLASASRPL